MATRIPLYSANPAYFAEDDMPQFNSPTPFTLSTNTEYLVSLDNGPVMLWLNVMTGSPSVIVLTSGLDSFGRRADSTINVQGSPSEKSARFFTRDVWADANGDLAFEFLGPAVTTVIPVMVQSDDN